MARNKAILEQGYIDACAAAQATKDVEQAQKVFAAKLADAIDAYITSCDVTGQVITTGSATTQSGPLLQGKII